MTNQFTAWPDEAIEKLTKLRSDGLSASQIAYELACVGFRYSRNAICGKVHRLGLAAPDKPATSGPRRLRKPKPSGHRLHSNLPPRICTPVNEVPVPEDFATVALPVSANPVSFDQLQHHHCRALLDSGFYCGDPRGTDWRGQPSSYCKAHHARFNVAPVQRQRRSERLAEMPA
jgi:GcrA cell cycle regulator